PQFTTNFQGVLPVNPGDKIAYCDSVLDNPLSRITPSGRTILPQAKRGSHTGDVADTKRVRAKCPRRCVKRVVAVVSDRKVVEHSIGEGVVLTDAGNNRVIRLLEANPCERKFVHF